MKYKIIFTMIAIILSLTTGCVEDFSGNLDSNESQNNSKKNAIQTINDDDIADSLLTQIIGYVTEEYDTVDVVDIYYLHYPTDGTKWLYTRNITPSNPEGIVVPIKFYDPNPPQGLSSNSASPGNCEADEGCPSGQSCKWTGNHPLLVCDCAASASSPCKVTTSGIIDLTVYQSTGDQVRASVVVSDLETYYD